MDKGSIKEVHMNFKADFERFDKLYPVKSKQINGLTFNYRFGGNGEKTLVLLIGGLGISDAFYNHFVAFAESFTVLTFDYPTETCRNSVLADGIAELIKSLDLKNVFLVGQSYGGLISQVIAKRHPELVSGLVLSNTGCLDSCMEEEARNYMLQMMAGLQKSIRLVRVIPMPLFRRILLKRLEKHFTLCTPDERQYMTDLFSYVLGRMTRKHELNMCRLMIDLSNETDIQKSHYTYLDKKVLLLLSEDDNTFGAPVKQALIRMMPNPVVNTGISGGHLALILKTDMFIDTVKNFVDSIE